MKVIVRKYSWLLEVEILILYHTIYVLCRYGNSFHIATFFQLSICTQPCIFPEDSFIQLSNGSIIHKFKKVNAMEVMNSCWGRDYWCRTKKSYQILRLKNPSLYSFTRHGYPVIIRNWLLHIEFISSSLFLSNKICCLPLL